jgi:hypothetical protein
VHVSSAFRTNLGAAPGTQTRMARLAQGRGGEAGRRWGPISSRDESEWYTCVGRVARAGGGRSDGRAGVQYTVVVVGRNG